MSFPSKMAAVSKWRPFFAYNSGTVRHTAMKFDADVPWGDPLNILEERTNLIYITTAILKNGGRYRVFAYNSETVIDTGTKFDTDVCSVVLDQWNLFHVAMPFPSKMAAVPRWRPLRRHNSRTERHIELKVSLRIQWPISWSLQLISSRHVVPLQNGGRSKMAAVFCL
jgi:hypothetical protein